MRRAPLGSPAADRMVADYDRGDYRHGDEDNPRSPWFEGDEGEDLVDAAGGSA